MRYPNAPDRERLLESIDDNLMAVYKTLQMVLAGEAPTKCRECKESLEPSNAGPLFCHKCGVGWDPYKNDWAWTKWGPHGWIAQRTRVWCDFNGPNNDRIRLTFRGSLESLKENPVYVGEHVLLTDDDIHVEAVIEQGDGCLIAVPDWSTKGDCEDDRPPACSECGVQNDTVRPDADAAEYYCDTCGYKLAGCSDE
jgi:hypothetical protein